MAYCTQRKLLINGRYHCPHCLSKAIQIKAVLVFSCVQFALFIASSNTEIPSANNCPLWYLISTRILQILLSFTLSLLPNRVYKFSAHIKKEALESRLNLIGYLSHEMRSPLNTAFLGLEYINGEMSKIGERLALSNEKTQTVTYHELVSAEQIEDILTTSHHVLDSCRVATTTLDDLLTADKIGDGKLLINPLPCNPWGLFKSCIGPFTINANEKNITFVVTSVDRTLSCLLDDTKPETETASSCCEYSIEVDEFKISQVIRNMLSNALKFTPPEGQVSMDIEIVLASPENSAVRSISKRKFDRIVRLSVKDTGPGIALEDQKKLFGKYVQFNAGALQKGKGSGLGLWISKSELLFFVLAVMSPNHLHCCI